MSSAEIVAFVERKLEQHGVTKVVPDTVTLAAAWARARKAQEVNRFVATVNEQEAELPPDDLEPRLHELMRNEPALSWSEAVVRLMTNTATQ
jgi:hypothetical protein